MQPTRFDVEALYSALDQERQTRNMTWRAVSQATGVSASTLTRMSQGRRPDLDGMAALVDWSGLSANSFVRSSRATPSASTIAKVTAIFRADRDLPEDAVQRLTELVQHAYELAKP